VSQHGERAVRLRGLIVTLALGALAALAILTPEASASTGGSTVPAGFLGLPSLHSIIEAIAAGFFGALAKALVPSWLTHGTVATIQQLVALPDPGEWRNVGALEGEMTYLGAMLAPVTLTVAALRYWAVGLTGSAHPASALVRCATATGVLVAYRWIVEVIVAGTNTVTHGVLGLSSVSAGLSRIIGVLFGGALLSGAGGVFGAFLVIIGVVFAAGLFATQVLLTVVLAVLIVAGPPLIALAAIPELSHLAHAWRDALLSIALIPLGWTVLFATAGALCLDATSFTGGAGGLPGHVAAAFAGLITFALAVKLPLMLLGELRHVLTRSRLTSSASSSTAASVPAAERVRSAHARLRAIGLDGVPALGASVGAAAGALGAPRGGPLGAARRGLGRAASSAAGAPAHSAGTANASSEPGPTGLRQRFSHARAILARAPRDAAAAATTGAPARNGPRSAPRRVPTAGSPTRGQPWAPRAPHRPAGNTLHATASGTRGQPAGGAAKRPPERGVVPTSPPAPRSSTSTTGHATPRTHSAPPPPPPAPTPMHAEHPASSRPAISDTSPAGRPTREPSRAASKGQSAPQRPAAQSPRAEPRPPTDGPARKQPPERTRASRRRQR
jgi:hypothetical protein